MSTFTVYDDTKGAGICRACRAPLDWYETTQGRRMPVERGAVPAALERHADARVVLTFEASASHFANCTQADAFRRSRKVAR